MWNAVAPRPFSYPYARFAYHTSSRCHPSRTGFTPVHARGSPTDRITRISYFVTNPIRRRPRSERPRRPASCAWTRALSILSPRYVSTTDPVSPAAYAPGFISFAVRSLTPANHSIPSSSLGLVFTGESHFAIRFGPLAREDSAAHA